MFKVDQSVVHRDNAGVAFDNGTQRVLDGRPSLLAQLKSQHHQADIIWDGSVLQLCLAFPKSLFIRIFSGSWSGSRFAAFSSWSR
ncbi:hypothetical protein BGZ96_004179 [Linnemannia gamsii]|uniref:Uncharacterized protein n=1 Tax=Linnemannia gamsii TaxID=64522 RepID=A0ABQ7K775_9FUNG|nr:hypothetical protein BGZ96_004179 [Linnemannia gamsii]